MSDDAADTLDTMRREMRAHAERRAQHTRRANRIAYAIVGCLIALTLWIRFSNPALTETQLFLEFWPAWLGIAVAVVGLRWFTSGA